ncbi:hypothetical protein GCM10022221_15910 [Actinocorallia aurea]
MPPPSPKFVQPPYAPGELPPGVQPNPAYRELYQTYSAVFGSIDALTEALNAPFKTFEATDAWLGPEARAWGEDLGSNRRGLTSAADTILWALHLRLSQTPRVITAG